MDRGVGRLLMTIGNGNDRHGRGTARCRFRLVGLPWLLLLAGTEARAHPLPPGPFAAPMPTDLQGAAPDGAGNERVTVVGRRPAFRTAPTAAYRDDRAPWEANRAIRDTMTGADTAAFGNAYNLGSPLGSDERSNETGGPYVAPPHP